ncbi:MAG: hypothetical protein ACOZAR_01630 [Patescibacteria group bacterium]
MDNNEKNLKATKRERKRKKRIYGMKIQPGAKTLALILKKKSEKEERKK